MKKTIDDDGINKSYNINGVLTLSTMHKGYRVSKTYIDYSLDEALELFKDYLKEG